MLCCRPIAHLYNNLPTKFGVPRQGGLVPALLSYIVFEPEYRNMEAVRGLEGYSHLWLLWHFSEGETAVWSPTVRPPRLGGNVRMGVWATRSPFRPNPIGLSCVRLERITTQTGKGVVLEVSGADLVNGTPLFDIKPYLPHIDCHPEALAGFAGAVKDYALAVDFPESLRGLLSLNDVEVVTQLLAQDPRPAYQNDAQRVYVLPYASYEISFCVSEGIARVLKVDFLNKKA